MDMNKLMDEQRGQFEAIRAGAEDIEYIAHSFNVVGNKNIANDLYNIAAMLKQAEKRLREIDIQMIDARVQEVHAVSGAVLSAALHA